MEFKKRYRYLDFLPFIIMNGIFLIGDIAVLIWLIAVRGNERVSGEIVGIIFCAIVAVGLLSIILILCCCVTIDEEKIELKDLRGTILSFRINDIYIKLKKIRR